MSRLATLYKSFISIIIHNHQSQIHGEVEIPEETMVQSLLDAPMNEMSATLNEMLHSLRHHSDHALFEYLLYAITVIQPILNTKYPITEEHVSSVIDALTNVVKHTQALLSLSKDASLHVTYRKSFLDRQIDIKGLLHKGYFTNALTPNGQLMSDKVMALFELSPRASVIELKAVITDIAKEQQKDILLCYQAIEIARLEQENARLRTHSLVLTGPRASAAASTEAHTFFRDRAIDLLGSLRTYPSTYPVITRFSMMARRRELALAERTIPSQLEINEQQSP